MWQGLAAESCVAVLVLAEASTGATATSMPLGSRERNRGASLPRVRAFLRVLELSEPAGFSRPAPAPAWPTLACARRSSPASLSGVVSGLATSRMRE